MKKGETMAEAKKNKRRLDKSRITLKVGESQRSDGTYQYRWTTRGGKRHYVYAKTLDELRRKEEQIIVDMHDGIKIDSRSITVNDIFEMWCDLKRGLKANTFANYKYMYNKFVRDTFGQMKLLQIKKSDVKRFYNRMADEKILSISTIDGVHNILHQIFDLAVDDNYIRANPTSNVLRELKLSHNFQVEKRKALTKEEQDIFVEFLKRKPLYNHWYPIFAVMLGTGMRAGETVGLRWCDIDLDEGMISVNHTLVFFRKEGIDGCSYAVNTPKIKAGTREIPMMDFVKEAFVKEREYQKEVGLTCKSSIDGFTDFVFLNRFGEVLNLGVLNKALKRIIRDCNKEILEKHTGEGIPILLPNFSCHTLRHTFTTRLCEAEVYVKTIQDILGHTDISTTMNIYADVTKAQKKITFKSIEGNFGNLV